MTQTSTIQHIIDSQEAHIQWVQRAEYLIAGKPVDQKFIPLEATTCNFGKWFYAEGAQLKLLSSMTEILQTIETNHNALHIAYAKIYQIYFIQLKQRSLLHKIFTFNSKKLSAAEKQEADIHFSNLKGLSTKLIDALKILQDKLQYISEEEREKLYTIPRQF